MVVASSAGQVAAVVWRRERSPRRRLLRSRSDAPSRGLGGGVRRCDAYCRSRRTRPGARRAAPLPALQRHRRDPAVDGARPPGRRSRQGPIAGGRGRRRRFRRRCPGGDGAAVRRGRVRVASGGRSADRVGDHDALRPGQAVRRPSGARRCRRDPLRRDCRRCVRRHAERAVRVVGGQARRHHRLGGPQRGGPRRELRVLRQRVRHPDAGRRGTPDRREPRPPHGAGRCRSAVADPQSRRVTRCAQGARDRPRGPGAGAPAGPPGSVPVRPLRHRRCREHPSDPAPRSSAATTAATSMSPRCR